MAWRRATGKRRRVSSASSASRGGGYGLADDSAKARNTLFHSVRLHQRKAEAKRVPPTAVGEKSPTRNKSDSCGIQGDLEERSGVDAVRQSDPNEQSARGPRPA